MSENEIAASSLPPNPLSSNENAKFSWWVQAIVVPGALLMITGALIALFHPAMLASPPDEINGAARIFAGYLAARNLALAIFLLAALFLRSRGTLNMLMLLTAFIQLFDTAIDCAEGRWPVVPGVMIFGALFLIAAAALSGHPFWKLEAWRQQT
jgi:hypothetical protein